MQKVLLTDVGFSSLPLLQYLQDLGLDTYVCGRSIPPNIGELIEDQNRWLNIDYSDVGRLTQEVSTHGFDHVVPGCNDVSYRAASEVVHAHGLTTIIDPPEAWDAVNDKRAFAELCDRLTIPVAETITDLSGPLPERLIIKPAVGYSGLGITIVSRDDASGLEQAISQARSRSANDQIIIQRFFDGDLYSLSAMFDIDGNIAFDALVKEGGSVSPFFVDTSFVDTHVPEALSAKVRDDLTRIHQHLSLTPGLMHLQFLKNGTDYIVVELTRRCPGDLYSELIQRSTGYPYPAAYVNSFLGLPLDFAPADKTSAVVRHSFVAESTQKFKRLEFSRPLNMLSYYQFKSLTDDLAPLGRQKLGLAFIDAGDQASAEALFEAFLARSVYRIE